MNAEGTALSIDHQDTRSVLGDDDPSRPPDFVGWDNLSIAGSYWSIFLILHFLRYSPLLLDFFLITGNNETQPSLPNLEGLHVLRLSGMVKVTLFLDFLLVGVLKCISFFSGE